MKREIVASAIGLACLSACGNDRRPGAPVDGGAQTDAPPASPSDASADAPARDAGIDGPILPAPDPTLRLRYDFEDTAAVVTDSSGRGFHGTLSDVSARTAGGRNGRGLALHPVLPRQNNGLLTPQFVSLPSGVLTGVNDFTVSVWVKTNAPDPNATIDPHVRIYDFGNGKLGPDERFMFFTLHGFTPPTAPMPNEYNGIHATSFTGAAPGAETFLGTKTQLPIGVWKHVAITGAGGKREIFIDGFPASVVTGGTVVPPSEMEPLSPQSWIGRSRFPDAGLDATLDDFRIYNKVLSATEIGDLGWPQNDYSNWRFDEGTGTTTRDSSDRAIATTLVDNATWTTGRLGGAVNLTGGPPGPNGPHVALARSPLMGCTNSATVTVWVKLRTAGVFTRIFDFGDGGTFFFLTPSDNGGKMRFAMGKAGMPAFDLIGSRQFPADDAWHHAAVTINAGVVTLYLDGAPIAPGTMSPERNPGEYSAVTNNLLGKSQFPLADSYLDGALDDLRVSCRAYTADEIKALAFPMPPS